uniref:Tripartite motif-containing protein 45 n=1 Tax=Bombyx mori TaxID=7091 RepID=A0A8R2C7B6_BOMMO|nr:tripartite motif-containing protein 45 isoform X1 [Bombyx mori]
MEVDRILYIFGSFTRKKDKRKSLEPSSISAGNSPLRTRPASQSLSIAPRTSAYDKKDVMKEWICGICRKELVEPRLLGCLHSFCTSCLQGLHQEGACELWSEVDRESIQQDPAESGSGLGSAGSGYESDLRHSDSEGSWEHKNKKYGILTRKISGKSVQFVVCPTCGQESALPLGGIAALPLNYVLLRKMNSHENGVAVLCDLCDSDHKAVSRCGKCLISICSSCGDAHERQPTTARHVLEPLHPPVRYCSQHPKAELCIYCATCQQVVCRECCVVSHGGHALAAASRAAAERARVLRAACDRAAHVPGNVQRAARALQVHAAQVDAQASKVESEVETWAAEYSRAVEAHGRALLRAAGRARCGFRRGVRRHEQRLDERVRDAHEAVAFAQELLSGARDDELLSLSGPVLRRLERVTEVEGLGQAPQCEVRFAPLAPAAPHSTLYGRLLTQAPDPDKCVLDTEGLQDLMVNCQHETVLELRDCNGERIWCGGEQVSGYLRRRDSSARPAGAAVTDRADGRYTLAFTPAAPGAYLLAVTVANKPIKGSPFPCAARVGKTHNGQYHCCSFCSSGGKRDASCACGATMPGGYKGCGHGHTGWPGTRHWSCCGATQRHSVCTRRPTQSRLYQFSL